MEVNMEHSYIVAKGMNLNSTPRKLSLVADLIRGKKVEDSLRLLTFCNKKASLLIKKVLQSALFNAQNNFGLDVDSLFVREVLLGRSSSSFYRMSPRARGKGYRIRKIRCNVVVKLFAGGI